MLSRIIQLQCEAPGHYSSAIRVRPTWSPCDHILISPSPNVNASQVVPTTHQYVVVDDNFWHHIIWSHHDPISPFPNSYLPNPLRYFKFITWRLWPTLQNTDQHWGQREESHLYSELCKGPCDPLVKALKVNFMIRTYFPPRSSVDRCYDYLA